MIHIAEGVVEVRKDVNQARGPVDEKCGGRYSSRHAVTEATVGGKRNGAVACGFPKYGTIG